MQTAAGPEPAPAPVAQTDDDTKGSGGDHAQARTMLRTTLGAEMRDAHRETCARQ